MAHHPLTQAQQYSVHRAASGSMLVVGVVFVFVLILLLASLVGVAMVNLLSETLQHAVSDASLVGASALWDEVNPDGTPQLSAAPAEAAARATFAKYRQQVPLLNTLNAELTSLSVDAGAQTVTLKAQGSVSLPFVSTLNLQRLEVQGASTARYAVHRVNLPASALAGHATSGSACDNPLSVSMTLPLAYPLTDRPGLDLVVSMRNGAGYRLLACAANQCRDIGGAARPLDAPTVSTRVRQAPASANNSSPIQVVYGSAAVDLGAIGSVYNQHVKRATVLRLIDDAVPDVWQPGDQHTLELCPSRGAELIEVLVLHQAHLCVGNSNECVYPTGLSAWGGLPASTLPST
jgi:hypothetical protein